MDDEEKSQEGSLKEKSSSLKSSKIASKSIISTIVEEEEEEFVDYNDVEGTIATRGSELSEDITDEKDKETEAEEELLKDPGLSSAYLSGPEKLPKDEVDGALYLRLVKEAKIMPIKRIVNGLHKSGIYLQYYGLDNAQMKPLAEALMDNVEVKELNLQSNSLGLDAMYHLGLMLRRNTWLNTLRLSQCKITAEGLEMLGSGLEICPQLAFLDLSYNEFGDKGMEILAVNLCYNTSITDLNLSHNDLTHKTGFSLAETMEENYTLQNLDLSWNQISEDQGLKKFLLAAAEHNESLLSLDLSWNTLSGEKTANIIKTFIGQHKTIQKLNLSHNRFETAAEVTKIAKGINSVPSLREINLSYNSMTADVAFALLSNISNKTKLKVLRMDNVWVKSDFEKMRKELEAQMEMRVIIEGVSGGFGAKGPDMQTLLLKRAHHLGNLPKKPKNRKDFGWFLLRLQKTNSLGPVKKAKFEKLVTEDKIKFDDGMVEELAKRFRDDNKKINLNLMLEKYMVLYPKTALPTVKEKKKRDTSKGKKKSKEGEEKHEVESQEKQGKGEEWAKEEKEEGQEGKEHTADGLEEIPQEKVNKESIHPHIVALELDEPERENKEKSLNLQEGEEVKPEISDEENLEKTEGIVAAEKVESEKKGGEVEEIQKVKEEVKDEVNEENTEVNDEDNKANEGKDDEAARGKTEGFREI